MGLIQTVRRTVANKVDTISHNIQDRVADSRREKLADKAAAKMAEQAYRAEMRKEKIASARVIAHETARAQTSAKVASIKSGFSSRPNNMAGVIMGGYGQPKSKSPAYSPISGFSQPRVFNPITGQTINSFNRKEDRAYKRGTPKLKKIGGKFYQEVGKFKRKKKPLSQPSNFNSIMGNWG